ncbi:hypothetical protein C493_03430, partial [Natronolimnohabitans innermongolicus JCM 12255]
MDDNPDSRLARWAALCGFAAKRLLTRARTAPRQTAALVSIVALTVALLLVVTGIGVALADDPSGTTDADFRVAPAEGGSLSSVVEVEGPRLDDVHDRTADVRQHDDVEYATPVLAEPVEMRTTDGDDTVVVLALGVVADDPAPTVAGISTDALGSDDADDPDGGETG